MNNLFSTPTAFMKSIDFEVGKVTFVPMTRETYVDSNFLDHRLVPAGTPYEMALSDMIKYFEARQPKQQKINFIFHTTFCGSTLLSRCLDHANICLAYKEPFPLHALSFRERPRWKPKDQYVNHTLLQIIMAHMGKTFGEAETALIKPSESCNNLAEKLMQLHPNSKAILLYSDLASFTISTLKHPNRKQYLQASLPRALEDIKALGVEAPATDHLSDGDAAGLVWFSLMGIHAHLHDTHHSNITTLNAKDFYASPLLTLEKAAKFFDLNYPPDALQQQVETGAFRRDAKKVDVSYNPEFAALNKQKLAALLSKPIHDAQYMVDKLCTRSGITLKLSKNLLLD